MSKPVLEVNPLKAYELLIHHYDKHTGELWRTESKIYRSKETFERQLRSVIRRRELYAKKYNITEEDNIYLLEYRKLLATLDLI